MPIVIDYGICDGVEGCPAVRICDAEALRYDVSTKRVEYDLERCRNCGTCAVYCGPGAVMHAATEEEWLELRSLVSGE